MPNDENKIILEFPATNVEIELGETITFDNISGFLDAERVTYNGDSLTEKITHLENDKADTTYVDEQLSNKMDKSNPTGTGRIAVGSNMLNIGSNSQTFGSNTKALGNNAFATGENTQASVANQFVFGKYNQYSFGNLVEIVGNGTNESNRSNARTLDWQGNETLAGDLTFNGNKSLTSEISRLDGKIDNLPAPMIFKGTLGVGGTIQTLPTASASNEGYTYKVITDGTYAGQTAKVGDVFTSNGSAWVLIPSGDEDNDTWRAIKINGVEKLGNGISSGAVDFEDTANVKFTFDSNGNKVKATLSGIYTSSEVNDLLDDKADADNTYTKAQVDDIVYGILPDDTASGAIANFTTSVVKPLVNLTSYFKATQEAGTPTPQSPKAISGVSAVSVIHCGANLFDKNTAISNYYINDETGEARFRTEAICTDFIPIKGGQRYYFLNDANMGNWGAWYDSNKQYISACNGVNISLLAPQNACYCRRTITYSSTAGGHAETFALLYPATATTYEAYNSSTTLINLGGTYYGGHFTQDKAGHRQLVVTHGIKLFGDIAFNYSNNAGQWQRFLFYGVINDKLSTSLTLLCTNYEVVNEQLSTISNEKMLVASWGNYIYIRDDAYTTVEDFKTANANTQVVYELATPIIIDLPDGEPINTFAGVNNFFADTGDTEVVFKSSVNDYVSAHSGGNLLGMGGVYLGGAKSGGSEEEPTEESEEPKEELKEVTKTLGDEPISKKLGGE